MTHWGRNKIARGKKDVNAQKGEKLLSAKKVDITKNEYSGIHKGKMWPGLFPTVQYIIWQKETEEVV